MKALAKLKAEPGIWMTDVPKPSIGPNDVLIKIKKTAICGTDLHIYNWDQWAQANIKPPMHVGHEFVGEIVEKGALVTGLDIGDRVSGEGHITCGYCRNCRGGREHLCPNTKGIGVNIPGAFAEYLAMPARNVFKIPTEIDDDLVSIFDPFGNAVHTALSFDLIGEDILITGAGPIGIMAAAVCRHVGARHIVITDISDYRLKLAKKMGATIALNVRDIAQDCQAIDAKLRETMQSLSMTEGFDIGLEMSGNNNAICSMIDMMNCGGRIAALGLAGKRLSINWDKVVLRGLHVKGIYGREMFETWYKMITMLQSGLDISKVITHRLPVDDYIKGFELMKSGECGKVVLSW